MHGWVVGVVREEFYFLFVVGFVGVEIVQEGDANKEGREDEVEVYKTRRVVDDCKENRQQDYNDDNGVRRG